MFTKKQFIDTVLSYEGTPYQHQGREKGVAIDCIGLIVAPMRDLGEDMSYVPKNYGKNAHPKRLLKALHDSVHAELVDPGPLEDGDILVFNYQHEPRHFAVYLGGGGEMIHSYYQQNVIITDFSQWECLLHSVWRINFSESV